MIKRFDIYNESVRDKMTPKSGEEIEELLKQHEESFAEKIKFLKRHCTELANKYDSDVFFSRRKDTFRAKIELNMFCYTWIKINKFNKFFRPDTLCEIGVSDHNSKDTFYYDFDHAVSELDEITGVLYGYPIRESVRDRMTPKPFDVEKFKKLSLDSKIRFMKKNSTGEIYPIKEMEREFEKLSRESKQEIITLGVELDILDTRGLSSWWMLTQGTDEDLLWNFQVMMSKLCGVNESVGSLRQKMTPKNEGDLEKALSGMGPYERMRHGARYGILSAVRGVLDNDTFMPTIVDEMLEIARKYENTEVVEYLEEYIRKNR